MSEFAKGYKNLNKKQRQAVDIIDGPLLVIAGPGTGKTQLLSLRVANILDKTDTAAENILCLTFTNKAAKNMQLRLSRLIGSDAHRVTISTFHSFAGEIMSLFPEYFWKGARLAHVPDAVQTEIITDILSTLPLDNTLALKFAGKYTSVKDVMEGLKLSKEAGLTPEKLRALIELNLAYIDKIEPELVEICAERLTYKKLDELALQIESLEEQQTDRLTRPLVSLSTVISESFEAAHTADMDSGKTKNTSLWKRRWITAIDGVKGMHEERKRNAWWLALSEVYMIYRNKLHERGFYDYADMIIEVITQLEQHSDLLSEVQERYQYVLIDEFQDTNSAQLRLAHLVADHHASNGNPNIMAVGDDDQSIYKFNGAELSNMLDFTRQYPNCQVLVLTDNYRSTQEILDVSMKVIQNAGIRLSNVKQDLDKTLVAKNSPIGKSIIKHLAFPTQAHEYYMLAQKISELSKRTSGSIAVLARSHESLRSMASALQSEHVSVRYEQQQSIFDEPLIVNVLQIAETIDAIRAGDEAQVNSILSQMLTMPAWNIDPKTLWRMAIENRRKPHWLDYMLEGNDEKLKTIAWWLLWLSKASSSEPATLMIEYIVGLKAAEHLTSPLRQFYLEQDTIDTPYLSSISGIKKLLALTDEFNQHGSGKLADFVRLIRTAKQNNQSITDESLFVTSENAVELLTVHKAKGLEFDSVFIIDAMENVWQPNSHGRKPPANLPLKPNGDDYDDYVRLFYVAMTRAKQNLFVSSFYSLDNGEAALASSIIRDILLPEEIPYKTGLETTNAAELSVSWPRLDGSEEELLLKDILENFTLSPSSFLDFLDVNKGGPQYFLEKYLLSLPEAKSVKAAFGSAIHSSLEYAQRLSVDDSFSLALVQNSFSSALMEQNISDGDFERYLKHGKKVLERLFENYELKLNKNSQAELPLNVMIENIKMSGKIDLIERDGNNLKISDYKTGSPLTSFTTQAKNLQLKAWRHRTQLELYVLMAQASNKFKEKSYIGNMIYVEAENIKQLSLSIVVNPDALSNLTKLITIVDKKIRDLNLPDTRHYDPSYIGTEKFIEDLLAGNI